MNLLKETVEHLAQHGKSPADVAYVMRGEQSYNPKSPAIAFNWFEFAALADFDYHDGFGGNEVEGSLKVVGSDWWLERGEYDGSEWWEFKTMPTRPEYGKPCQADLMESR